MLNICFSETAYISLTQAVKDGFLIESDTVCLADDLSLGNISSVKSFETRKDLLAILYHSGSYADTVCRNYHREFHGQIYNHDKVRIWYSVTPAEYCGFLYTLWLLQESPVQVEAICCSRTLKKGEQLYTTYHQVSDVAPEAFIRFLPFGALLKAEEVKSYASEWEKLREENARLRVVWNQTVQSAQVGYYDRVILKLAEKQEWSVAALTEELMRQENLYASKVFLAARIKLLAGRGILDCFAMDGGFWNGRIRAADEKESHIQTAAENNMELL